MATQHACHVDPDDADAQTDDRVVVTDTTLPAAPEDLEFYTDDGDLYAKHEETGDIVAITDSDAGTELSPVLGDISSADSDEIETVDPHPVDGGETDLDTTISQPVIRRGD